MEEIPTTENSAERSTKSRSGVATRAWLALSGGGAGGAGTLLLLHQAANAADLIALISVALVGTIASLLHTLPSIIAAVATARCALMRERERMTIIEACLKSATCLESATIDQITEILKIHADGGDKSTGHSHHRWQR